MHSVSSTSLHSSTGRRTFSGLTTVLGTCLHTFSGLVPHFCSVRSDVFSSHCLVGTSSHLISSTSSQTCLVSGLVCFVHSSLVVGRHISTSFQEHFSTLCTWSQFSTTLVTTSSQHFSSSIVSHSVCVSHFSGRQAGSPG